MATSVISNTLLDPDIPDGTEVIATLMPTPGFRVGTLEEIPRRVEGTITSLAWALTLERNADILPAGTWWLIEEKIPELDGAHNLWPVEVGPTDTLLYQSLVTPAVATGFGNYLTREVADTLYAAIGIDVSGYAPKVKFFIEDYGASVGSADNTAAIQAAITAATAAPQGVLTSRRPADGSTATFKCASPLVWADGITFELEGPRANYIRLEYTGNGDRFIDARSLTRVGWKGVRFQCSGATFAGPLVDLDDATFWFFEKCEWGVATGAVSGTGYFGVNFPSGHNGSFREYRFDRMNVAVKGGGNSVEFSGAGYFTNGEVAYILNPGTGWLFNTPTIEPLLDGTAGFVKYDSPGTGGGNVTVVGGWASDITVAGGAWFDLQGTRGIVLNGGFYAVRGADTALIRQGSTDALGPVSIIGTRIDSPTALGGPGPVFDYTIAASTSVIGDTTAAASAILLNPQWTGAGTPLIFKSTVIPTGSIWHNATYGINTKSAISVTT